MSAALYLSVVKGHVGIYILYKAGRHFALEVHFLKGICTKLAL